MRACDTCQVDRMSARCANCLDAESTARAWVATANGCNILTVIAEREADARDMARDQLSLNPSRWGYLKRWQETGEAVEVRED